ncbi:MAG: alanyl-tRNA editing protein [Theionarchaea archaeon]|nr:alanyl-tRNA editing protein [Theionarchaea archaeon]
MNVKTHTALHVLKGAVQAVLHTQWTAGTWIEGCNGRLTVQYNRKPTPEELHIIEREANLKIQENLAIDKYVMEREKAEEKWGNAIYDLFPVPESIHELEIVHIENWNVNACREQHTKTTGDIEKITLGKVRFRGSKQLLEISFSVPD